MYVRLESYGRKRGRSGEVVNVFQAEHSLGNSRGRRKLHLYLERVRVRAYVVSSHDVISLTMKSEESKCRLRFGPHTVNKVRGTLYVRASAGPTSRQRERKLSRFLKIEAKRVYGLCSP